MQLPARLRRRRTALLSAVSRRWLPPRRPVLQSVAAPRSAAHTGSRKATGRPRWGPIQLRWAQAHSRSPSAMSRSGRIPTPMACRAGTLKPTRPSPSAIRHPPRATTRSRSAMRPARSRMGPRRSAVTRPQAERRRPRWVRRRRQAHRRRSRWVTTRSPRVPAAPHSGRTPLQMQLRRRRWGMALQRPVKTASRRARRRSLAERLPRPSAATRLRQVMRRPPSAATRQRRAITRPWWAGAAFRVRLRHTRRTPARSPSAEMRRRARIRRQPTVLRSAVNRRSRPPRPPVSRWGVAPPQAAPTG